MGRRKETNDYSRYILAIFCWFTSLLAFVFIFRTVAGNTIPYKNFLDPEHTFAPLLIQLTFFFYPLAVVKSIVKPGRTCTLLFAPPLLVFIIGMFSGIEYTSLYTFSDIWNNIGKADVLFRIFAVIVMLVYAFALFFVPYDWRKSSADRKFILRYSLGYCCIGLILIMEFITHAKVYMLLHQLVCLLFFFWTVWYELKERLPVPGDSTKGVGVEDSYNVIDILWVEITRLLVEQQGWRDPDLSLQSLSQELASNRTYIAEAFKKFAGCTFSEYIAKRRIEYVVSELNLNPKANLQRLFSQAGYRQRSTAYRNFHKIMGVSPTEYLERLP